MECEKDNEHLKKITIKDTPEVEFIKRDPKELFFVWEITKDVYSFVWGKMMNGDYREMLLIFSGRQLKNRTRIFMIFMKRHDQ